MPTVAAAVARDEDDALEVVATGVVSTSDLVVGSVLGASRIGGFRFEGLEQLAGRQLTRAELRWRFVGSSSIGQGDLLVYAQKAAAPASFTASNGNLSDRPLTTAAAPVPAASYVSDEVYVIDVRGPLQELIDAGLDLSAVVLLVYHAGWGQSAQLRDHDNSPELVAALSATYPDPGPEDPMSENFRDLHVKVYQADYEKLQEYAASKDTTAAQVARHAIRLGFTTTDLDTEFASKSMADLDADAAA
jgi:hypothetical protein